MGEMAGLGGEANDWRVRGFRLCFEVESSSMR